MLKERLENCSKTPPNTSVLRFFRRSWYLRLFFYGFVYKTAVRECSNILMAINVGCEFRDRGSIPSVCQITDADLGQVG